MSDVLKYYPLTFVYDGHTMMVPMGEVISIHSDSPGQASNAIITARTDAWDTDSSFDSVMDQWVKAIAKFGNH